MGHLRAVFMDLGDVIMQETTEQKDADGVTLQAELVPGMADVIQTIKDRGIPLALVADTRHGTAVNVLKQHGLTEFFPVQAISEDLGVRKPHPKMFDYALKGLGITDADKERVVMVGNNLARDIEGAARTGMKSIWFHWNDRYPTEPEGIWQRPDYTVHSAQELLDRIVALDEGDQERSFVAQAAPEIIFDSREPFFPIKVGYSIFQAAAPSPSFPRGIDLYIDEERTADTVIEYAVYWDWDIGHHYDLEHIWVFLDQHRRPLRIDASWHGTYHVQAVAGATKPLPQPFPLYSQPGKHAFSRSPDSFLPKERYTLPCTKRAGNAGLLITRLFDGIIEKREEDDAWASAYLKGRAFEPSFTFDQHFSIDESILVPWPELFTWIPRRIDKLRQSP